MRKSKFVRFANRMSVKQKRSESQIKNGDILLSYIGLLCQGKTDFETVGEMRDDPDFYKDALGIKRGIPAAETMRQRMDDIVSSLRKNLLQTNVSMLRNHLVIPSEITQGLVPMYLDVTPFDNSKTKKESVSRIYKRYDGYAPMMAYIGAEGFMANCELREGKQHCQKNTSEFLRETLALCHQLTDKPLLVRVNAGNDAAENIGILIEDDNWFVIKRNLRQESKQEWLEKVRGCCKDIRDISHPRDGKTVYAGASWKDVTYRTDAEEKKI